ncbi:MAG TPA: hypothetical protein VNV42_10105 [Solirubrobacteraceae bacterium]|jgi:hypothetical protein|nr:hypothetical protein [Solirubrobacteraceae bacterium]
MARFCRHNRFIERCPICRETVPGLEPERAGGRSRSRTGAEGRAGERSRAAGRDATGAHRTPQGRRRAGLQVSHEQRADDDGYRSPLATGLRASEDAERLAQEIAFAEGRLLALRSAPPDLYAEMREQEDPEQALWMAFLSAYLCPLESAEPFAGIRRALRVDWRAGELPDLGDVPLGPRTSHDPARGDATLRAYREWAARAGSQAQAYAGDAAWSPARRFERIFERLTLPGFARMGRYELLVTLGRVGLCDLRAETLCFANALGPAHDDLATTAAKRLFAIGEPMHLEHRAKRLAEAMSVPLEAFDQALANWGAGERATLGFPAAVANEHVLERAREALEL